MILSGLYEKFDFYSGKFELKNILKKTWANEIYEESESFVYSKSEWIPIQVSKNR